MFERLGFAADGQRKEHRDRECVLGVGFAVFRRFRSPFLPFLILPGATTAPFVVGSARLPPGETRRERPRQRGRAAGDGHAEEDAAPGTV